jgi:hypothetical protein
MKIPQILTSVKVNSTIWDEFRISCVKYKFSLQKLADRAMHLYLTDHEFRKKIHNHTNIEIETKTEN